MDCAEGDKPEKDGGAGHSEMVSGARGIGS